MADEWNLPDGPDQTPFSTLVEAFRGRGISLIRDAGCDASRMPGELAKVASAYVRDNKLAPAEASRIHLAANHGGAEARRYHQHVGGRYTSAAPAKQEPWSPARQREFDAERAAVKAAAVAPAKTPGGPPPLTLPGSNS